MKKKAVIVSCFNWYKSRLEPIREMLILHGFDVEVLIADFEHIKRAPIKEKHIECTYLKVPHYKSNISFQRIKSHITFGKMVGSWLNGNKPDLIFCQVPPNIVAYECLKYKQRFPITKFFIDIIDLWPESMPIGVLKKIPVTYFWKKMRNEAIKCADYVFTECDLYQKKLGNLLSFSRSSTLYLFKNQAKEEKEIINKILAKKKKKDTIKFAYLGSMNNIIDIDGICFVLKRFINKGYNCELFAIGDGESCHRFYEAVKKIGCVPHFYGKIFDEHKKIKILTPCDYAFNMMKKEVSVGLTTKSIDYLSYGLPLINNIKGDTWELVEDNNIGINVEGNRLSIKCFDHKKVINVFEQKFSKENFTKIVAKGMLL